MSHMSGKALWLGVLTLVILGCARPAPSAPREGAQPSSAVTPSTDRSKSITVGITSTVNALAIVVPAFPVGGWTSMNEIHSEGLVTADTNSRTPVGRLAEQVPSLANGGITTLPDGRMKVVFNLRKGVTWQDGTPFTAQDMVFSYQVGGPGGIPQYLNGAVPFMSSVEAIDPSTLAIFYKAPYFQAALLGPFMFWPLPQHLLGGPYEAFQTSKDPNDVINSPYWTAGYVHLGPFRLTQFDPGNELTFQAYDGYFLGPPRVGTIRVRVFSDENTLYTNLIAGEVHITAELALRVTGPQLKDMWDTSGDGTVYSVEGGLRRFDLQMRPELQIEPTLFDPRVRAALLRAADREAISDAANGGNPQLAAWSILARKDPLYEATRDGLRGFDYNLDRARALLQEAGWVVGSDGAPRHSADGRPFRTAVYTSIGSQQDATALAGYWRQLGLQVDEHVWTAAQTREGGRVRTQYPGWDGFGGSVLTLMGQNAASAENNWTGNPSGFQDPRAQQLVRAYRGSIEPSSQLQAMRDINEYVVAEMPTLPLYFFAYYLAARKGVRAITPDDVAGFLGDGPTVYAYGTLSRNARLWDLQ